jgi:hypothetical protein
VGGCIVHRNGCGPCHEVGLGMFQVKNWDKYQHYKDRSPPWIKLHRALLNDRGWHALSGDASKLLVECWLVASESGDGTIPVSVDDLAWRLRRTQKVASLAIQELVAQGFLEWCTQGASAVLASCTTEGETERERETDKKRRVQKDDGTRPTDILFDLEWTEYPRKAGKASALKAWNRLVGKTDMTEVAAGIRRYTAYCTALGTEAQFIKHLASLLNSDEWREEWPIPLAVVKGGKVDEYEVWMAKTQAELV